MRKRQRKPVPRLRSDLSYRAGLIDFLDRAGWDATAIVQSVLDEHAHELAEQQREHAEDRWAGDDPDSVLRRVIAGHQADLIDPEVST